MKLTITKTRRPDIMNVLQIVGFDGRYEHSILIPEGEDSEDAINAAVDVVRETLSRRKR